MGLPSFPEKPSLCRFCNHLGDVHQGAGCGVEDCQCPGFALPFTKADVLKQIRMATDHGISLEKLADFLGVPISELKEAARQA